MSTSSSQPTPEEPGDQPDRPALEPEHTERQHNANAEREARARDAGQNEGATAPPASSTPSSEGELPPEARGETNGGPLGCCLGVVVGIMLALLIGVIGVGPLLAGVMGSLFPLSAIDNTRIVTGIFAFIGAILFGYLGWKVGKRLYRDYEPPRVKRRPARRRARARAAPKEAR